MRRWVVGAGGGAAAVGGSAGGQVLPNAQTQFYGAGGLPLSGGYVYTYVPGTTTPKTTWQDSGLSVPNTDPIRLDANGQARIWGSGLYREVVQDANANLVWDAVTSASGCLEGPGNATIGYVPLWGAVNGCQLTGGLPVGTTGANTIVETQANGLIANGVLPGAFRPIASANYYL